MIKLKSYKRCVLDIKIMFYVTALALIFFFLTLVFLRCYIVIVNMEKITFIHLSAEYLAADSPFGKDIREAEVVVQTSFFY